MRPHILALALLGACEGKTDTAVDDTDRVDTDDTDRVDTDETDVDTDDTDVDTDVDTDDTDVAVRLDHVVPGAWGEGFPIPGFVGESAARVLDTLRLDDGRLVAAGIFDHVRTVPARNVAVRSAAGDWSELGGGLEDYVEDLLLRADGTLLAGGWRTTPDGLEGHVWALDGAAWTDLGTFDGRVEALAERDGHLLVGGWFSHVDGVATNGLAALDGDDWIAIPGLGEGSLVDVIFDHPGADVCVAGLIGEADGQPVGNVVCADLAGAWTPLGATNGEVFGVTVLNDGRRLAFGSFSTGAPPDQFIIGLAAWDGDDWVGVPELGVDGGLSVSVRALIPDGPSGYVLAGEFGTVGVYGGGGGGLPASNVARFDGTDWATLGDGLVATSGVFGGGVAGGWHLRREDDDVFVGGMFGRADGSIGAGLAVWDGSGMSFPFGTSGPLGLEGNGNQVGVADDGTVWVTAEVATHFYTPWLHVLDGDAFTDVHDGPQGYASDLLEVDGVVYVSGQLEGLGRRPCDVAAYEAGAWTCLVRDLWVPGSNDGVAGLAPDGLGGLVLTGSFTLDDGSTNVARWDGTEVLPLGTGLEGFGLSKPVVDPATGDVFLTGYSLVADGTPIAGIATWDGVAWTQVGAGDGVSGSIRSMAWVDGTLWIAGAYLDVPGFADEADPKLIAWDGAAFTEVAVFEDPPGQGELFTLVPFGDGAFVWGTWATVDGVVVDGTLLWWEDDVFTPLGVGTDDIVTDVAVGFDAVWVAGPFRSAGDVPSFGVARWVPTP